MTKMRFNDFHMHCLGRKAGQMPAQIAPCPEMPAAFIMASAWQARRLLPLTGNQA